MILTCIITKDKIKKVVCQCESTKSLKPNGYNFDSLNNIRSSL